MKSSSRIGARLHFLDVGAGGERLLRAGQHDRADRRIGIERRSWVPSSVHQLVAQRVQRLRPVEPDQPDPAMGLDQDAFLAPVVMARSPSSDPGF